MKNLIIKIICALGNFASIIGLIAISNILWLQIIIALIGIASFVCLICLYVKESQINEVECKNNDEIKTKMLELINTQGKVCIVSRDLSWVDNTVKDAIIKKGQSMLIFASEETQLTKELIRKKIKVKYYGHLNFEPKTRFTIIRYNKESRQVAIANTVNSIRRKNRFRHVIYQTTGANQLDLWINSLAGDVIELMLKIEENS